MSFNNYDAEYQKEMLENRIAAVKEKLASLPPMSRDEDVWNGFLQDADTKGYRKVLDFGWARLMEAELKAGRPLVEVMGKTAFDADFDDRGPLLQSRHAKYFLKRAWAYQEELCVADDIWWSGKEAQEIVKSSLGNRFFYDLETDAQRAWRIRQAFQGLSEDGSDFER